MNLYGNSGIVERGVRERCRVKRGGGYGDRWIRGGRQRRGDGERRGGQRVVMPGHDLAASSRDDGRWNSGHSGRGHGQRGGWDQSGGRHRGNEEKDALKNREGNEESR